MTELHTLPIGHVLRNTPLIQIKAQYKHINEKSFREIGQNFGIAKNTYNQLGDVWVRDAVFIGELK